MNNLIEFNAFRQIRHVEKVHYFRGFPEFDSIDCTSRAKIIVCPGRHLASVHPESMFLDVILRGVYLELVERLRMTKRGFLRGAGPERLDLSSSTGLAEGLKMTLGSFRMDTS